MKYKKLILFFLFILLFFLIWLIIYLIPSVSLFSEKSLNVESNMSEKKYVALYIGDIDGEVSEDWFFFYDKLVDFYEEEKIPVAFSFYPVTIRDNEEFNEIFVRMYESEYIELMQKGYKGDEVEMRMEELSLEEQKAIIKAGQDDFKESMQRLLETDDIRLPTSYNQISGKFNEDTRNATASLGFNIYFDTFVGDHIDVLNSTETYDIIQYGVSFTKTGYPGKETTFLKPEELISEIDIYYREDLTVLTIDGFDIIPLWGHQQDFESKTRENKLDKEKWEIYTQTIRALKKDPNVVFVSPNMIYEMRH